MHHKEGSSYALLLPDVVERAHTLHRLAQPHLVGQHDRATGVPREEQPVESLQLVGAQRVAPLENGRALQLAKVVSGRPDTGEGDATLVGGGGGLPLAEGADGRLVLEECAARLPAAADVGQP